MYLDFDFDATRIEAIMVCESIVLLRVAVVAVLGSCLHVIEQGKGELCTSIGHWYFLA